MKGHLKGKPGDYIWDDNEKRFTGRFRKQELVEDRRFTAQAEYSFMNGVCKGLSLSHPAEAARALSDPQFNGYVVQGFSLIIDGVILSPEMWLSDASRLTGCQGIDSILTALGPLSDKERQAKLMSWSNIFGEELDTRKLSDDPEVVAARKRLIAHEKQQEKFDKLRKSWHTAFAVAKGIRSEYKAARAKKWAASLTGDEIEELIIKAIHTRLSAGIYTDDCFRLCRRKRTLLTRDFPWLFPEEMVPNMVYDYLSYMDKDSERETNRALALKAGELWIEKLGPCGSKGDVVKDMRDFLDESQVEDWGDKDGSMYGLLSEHHDPQIEIRTFRPFYP
tara:strand:- start:581 stop:1585 length:1005 start_codon:yes stop_codon:yes gene_type:complete